MPVLGTYRGADILQLPAYPAPRQIQLDMVDLVATPRSPFTGSVVQSQAWPGGDWWEATITLPKMTADTVGAWRAFLAQCRGSLNVFALRDSANKGIAADEIGTPAVSGVNAAMSRTLNIKGFPAGAARLLLPGDYLQLGRRLHRVLEQVDADDNGNGTAAIWPSIREAAADGDTIIFDKPTGLFRIMDNRRSTLTDETLLTGITFKAIEAK